MMSSGVRFLPGNVLALASAMQMQRSQLKSLSSALVAIQGSMDSEVAANANIARRMSALQSSIRRQVDEMARLENGTRFVLDEFTALETRGIGRARSINFLMWQARIFGQRAANTSIIAGLSRMPSFAMMLAMERFARLRGGGGGGLFGVDLTRLSQGSRGLGFGDLITLAGMTAGIRALDGWFGRLEQKSEERRIARVSEMAAALVAKTSMCEIEAHRKAELLYANARKLRAEARAIDASRPCPRTNPYAFSNWARNNPDAFERWRVANPEESARWRLRASQLGFWTPPPIEGSGNSILSNEGINRGLRHLAGELLKSNPFTRPIYYANTVWKVAPYALELFGVNEFADYWRDQGSLGGVFVRDSQELWRRFGCLLGFGSGNNTAPSNTALGNAAYHVHIDYISAPPRDVISVNSPPVEWYCRIQVVDIRDHMRDGGVYSEDLGRPLG